MQNGKTAAELRASLRTFRCRAAYLTKLYEKARGAERVKLQARLVAITQKDADAQKALRKLEDA